MVEFGIVNFRVRRILLCLSSLAKGEKAWIHCVRHHPGALGLMFDSRFCVVCDADDTVELWNDEGFQKTLEPEGRERTEPDRLLD